MPRRNETPRLLAFELLALPARHISRAPNRPLNWRWLRAKYQAENDDVTYDGELIHHCRKYHRYRQQDATRKPLENGFFELMDRIAELDDQLSLERLTLRCGIATGLSSRRIGELAQVPEAVVWHYRRLMFDLGPGSNFIRTVEQQDDVESVAICHCHFRGKLFIPFWQDYFQHRGETHDLSTPIGQRREQLELLVLSKHRPAAVTDRDQLNALRGLTCLPPSPDRIFTTPEILKRIAQQTLKSIEWGLPRPALDSMPAAKLA